MLNRGQICLSILRKEVNIGIFSVPDHLFDDGAQQAAFFLQRRRIHRAGKGLDHFLMEGKLLMQHSALFSEGFQLGEAQLLRTIVKKVVWDGKNAYVYLFAEDGEADLPPIDQPMYPLGEDSEFSPCIVG